VQDCTGTPTGRILAIQTARALNLAKMLSERVVGPDHAMDMIANRIQTSAAGLNAPEKPQGVFLLCGPSGVGKTETALALAETLFGGEQNLISINMSEFQEAHTVSTLKGAPPGYVGYGEGGVLTEAVRRKPYSVVLLDEIEKAHPEVFNLLLQVMDHGTLTDNNGRKADFRNAVIVMTTNAGSQEMSRASIGFTQQDHTTDGMEIIRKAFTPEFRNRLDAVISFAPLSKDVILQVVEKFVLQLEAQLLDRNVTIELTKPAAEWLGEKGYDSKMGARPLGRVIQENIKKPLAEEVLFGKLKKGGTVKVTVEKDELGESKLKLESIADEPRSKPKRQTRKPAAKKTAAAAKPAKATAGDSGEDAAPKPKPSVPKVPRK